MLSGMHFNGSGVSSSMKKCFTPTASAVESTAFQSIWPDPTETLSVAGAVHC